jgi:hypothetical protein
VRAAFPAFFAPCCNCDVLQGRARAGLSVSGVLEQSWRIGGATPAEVGALLAFKADPSLRRVRASSHEIYSAAPVLPAHADVHFDGFDDQVGRLRKYSVVELDE